MEWKGHETICTLYNTFFAIAGVPGLAEVRCMYVYIRSFVLLPCQLTIQHGPG